MIPIFLKLHKYRNQQDSMGKDENGSMRVFQGIHREETLYQGPRNGCRQHTYRVEGRKGGEYIPKKDLKPTKNYSKGQVHA